MGETSSDIYRRPLRPDEEETGFFSSVKSVKKELKKLRGGEIPNGSHTSEQKAIKKETSSGTKTLAEVIEEVNKETSSGTKTLAEVIEEVNKEREIKERKERENSAKYQVSAETFVGTFGILIQTENKEPLNKDDINKINLLFVYEKFKKSTFGEIINLYNKLNYKKSNELVASDNGFNGIDDRTLFYACKILVTGYGRQLIDKSYESKKQNPSNFTINDLILNLSSDLSIFKKMKEVKLEIGLDSFKNFGNELAKKVSLQEGGTLEGELKEKATNLGLNERILAFAFTKKDLKISELQKGSVLKNIDEQHLYPEDKEMFKEKLFPFYANVKNLIINHFSFDDGKNKNKEKFQKFFNNSKNDLTIKELLELYIITQGKTDCNNLNDIEKSLLYIQMWKILGKDQSFRGKHYDSQLIKILSVDLSIVPASVKEILGQIVGNKFDKATESTKNNIYEFFNAFYESYSTVDITIFLAMVILGTVGYVNGYKWYKGLIISTIVASLLMGMKKYAFGNEYVFPNGKRFPKETGDNFIKTVQENPDILYDMIINNEGLKKKGFIDKNGKLKLNEVKKIYLQANIENKRDILDALFRTAMLQHGLAFNGTISFDGNTFYVHANSKKEENSINEILKQTDIHRQFDYLGKIKIFVAYKLV